MTEPRPSDEPKDLSELAVPERETCIDAMDAGRRAHEFFDVVLDFLGYDERARRILADRQRYEFVRPAGDGPPLEDAVHVLRVDDRVVATVYEVRTDGNLTQFLPAHHLTEELADQLRSNLALLTDPGD